MQLSNLNVLGIFRFFNFGSGNDWTKFEGQLQKKFSFEYLLRKTKIKNIEKLLKNTHLLDTQRYQNINSE